MKKILKQIFILSVVSFIFLIPSTFAVSDYLSCATGETCIKLYHGSAIDLTYNSICKTIKNNHALNDYFIPPTTRGTDYSTFLTNHPADISITNCPAAVVTPAPSGCTKCADENARCSFTGTAVIQYGSGSTFTSKTLTGGTACTNAVFGDPTPNVVKACYNCGAVDRTIPEPTPTPTPTPAPAPTPTPVASVTDPLCYYCAADAALIAQSATPAPAPTPTPTPTPTTYDSGTSPVAGTPITSPTTTSTSTTTPATTTAPSVSIVTTDPGVLSTSLGSAFNYVPATSSVFVGGTVVTSASTSGLSSSSTSSGVSGGLSSLGSSTTSTPTPKETTGGDGGSGGGSVSLPLMK